jgi:hypothetical protein
MAREESKSKNVLLRKKMCVLYVSSVIFVCYLRIKQRLGFGFLCAATCDSIKMELEEVGWEGLFWIDLAEGRERRRAFL